MDNYDSNALKLDDYVNNEYSTYFNADNLYNTILKGDVNAI